MRESFAFKIFNLVWTVLILIINFRKTYDKLIFQNGLAYVGPLHYRLEATTGIPP